MIKESRNIWGGKIIVNKFPIPTRYLFVGNYSKGNLETLSIDEEDGLVTCGNAILGGSSLKTTEDIIKIEGLR